MVGKKKTQSGRQHGFRKSSRLTASKNTMDASDGLTLSNETLLDAFGVEEICESDEIITMDHTTATNRTCYLLDMTAEVRQKIWRYAVKEEKDIYPRQVERKSNKFWHFGSDTPPIVAGDLMVESQVKDKDPPTPLPTAVNLSLACHQIYDEIAGSGLFYKINNFCFSSSDAVHLYLVAITPMRRNALRSVTINWNSGYPSSRHALTMLATCEGLERVRVSVRWPYYWSLGFTQLTERMIEKEMGWLKGMIAKEMIGLKGLRSFELEARFSQDCQKHLPAGMSAEKCRIEAEKIGKEIEAICKQPREEAVHWKRIRAAEEASQLNIFGDGRLGPDKKPGIISSRTRGQLQKQKSLNDLGILQVPNEHPKYSQFGDLLWDIRNITDSRELATDTAGGRIEVQVTWVGPHDQSWEVLDRIINSTNVITVARHYVKHPEAYDIGVAVSTIKELVEKDDGKTYALDALRAVMERDNNPEAAEKAKRLHRLRAFR